VNREKISSKELSKRIKNYGIEIGNFFSGIGLSRQKYTIENKMIKIRFFNRGIALIVLILCFSYPSIVCGQFSGYDILNLDFSARSAGIGGAFVGISGDMYVLFYNPAGLAGIDNKVVGFTYLNHVLDIKSGNVVYISPRGTSTIGGGIQYINYGEFEGRDKLGYDTGSFNAQDIVFAGGIARKYNENIFIGVTAKALYSKIDIYSSSAILLDAGVIYLIPNQLMTIGAAISNIGFVAKAYQTVKDDLPTQMKIGVSKQLAHLPLLWSLEYRRYRDGQNQVVGGGEFSFTKVLKGRFGYSSYARDQKIDDESGTLAGISLGIGLYWKKYIIDYAFSSMGIIGNLNRLTIIFSL